MNHGPPYTFCAICELVIDPQNEQEVEIDGTTTYVHDACADRTNGQPPTTYTIPHALGSAVKDELVALRAADADFLDGPRTFHAVTMRGAKALRGLEGNEMFTRATAILIAVLVHRWETHRAD